MAGTYGTRDGTRFSPGGSLGATQYYTIVDTQGNITLKSPTFTGNANASLGGSGEVYDTTVGTIPVGGTFQPGSATTQETQYFSDPNNLKSVKNQAVITAQKGGATNAQQLIFPNTSQSQPTGDQQGGNPETTQPTRETIPTGQTEAVPSGQTGELNSQLKRIADPDLRYPLNAKGTQDMIMIQAFRIKPRTGGSTASSNIDLKFTFGSRGYEDVDGPVFLPIQAGISDQNSVDWGPDTVNAIDAALYGASIGLMQQETEDLGESVGNLAGQISKTLRAKGDRFGRYLAGQAASINNVLARTDNVVLNPNLELLFSGPQLRPFSFQFKMSARSEKEATQIKKIIKYFKYHMAVRQEVDQLFLRAPNVFKIEYMQSSKTKGLNEIKTCALTNCAVDYTPLGSYMTYEDGTMAAYSLSLQFQELEPIYDIDYTEAQSIGF